MRAMRYGLCSLLALLLAVSAGLTACGRKGPLERPPRSAAQQADAPPRDKVSDKPRRPFVIDRLVR